MTDRPTTPSGRESQRAINTVGRRNPSAEAGRGQRVREEVAANAERQERRGGHPHREWFERSRRGEPGKVRGRSGDSVTDAEAQAARHVVVRRRLLGAVMAVGRTLSRGSARVGHRPATHPADGTRRDEKRRQAEEAEDP